MIKRVHWLRWRGSRGLCVCGGGGGGVVGVRVYRQRKGIGGRDYPILGGKCHTLPI